MLTRAVARVTSRGPARVGFWRRPVGPTRPRSPRASGDRDVETSETADALELVFRGRPTTVRAGSKLRTALLRAGETPHNGDARVINCRGLGTCGTCAVQILGPEDAVSPGEWTATESARLNFPPHAPPGNRRLRLACQVRVGRACEVRKYDRFWGQGDAVSTEAAEDAAPLGALEFLLDAEEKER